MKKTFLLIFLVIFTVSSSAIILDQGWNTLSVNSEADISNAISENSDCEFERYEGEYIWKYDNQVDDWTHPNTLQPEDGFYLYTNNNCNLEIEQDSENNVDTLNLDSGWNMIGASQNQLSQIRSSCEIEPHLGGYFSFLNREEWYHPIVSASQMENRGYWLRLDEETCQVNFDEENDEPEEKPVKNSYLNLNSAEINSETVSADSEGLNIDFSFNRDSEIENEVDAEVGLHIDEKSSPVKSFEVQDQEDHTVSASWSSIWEEVGKTNTEASAQLVLQEKTTGDYRWNRDSIDAGEFTIVRCSDFTSTVNNNWELTYEPNDEERCLDNVKAGEVADGSQEILIRSNKGGVGGSVELRKAYHDTQGTERLTIDLNQIKDSSNNIESNLRIRHFKGGEGGDTWVTVLEDELNNIEPQTLELDFSKALQEPNAVNIVEITVENNEYNSNSDILEVQGDLQFERYPSDGPGTCQPGQTWCEGISQEGQCIEDENYEPGLCE